MDNYSGPTFEEARKMTESLVNFVLRVSSGENASPEEIAILPEIVKEVYRYY